MSGARDTCDCTRYIELNNMWQRNDAKRVVEKKWYKKSIITTVCKNNDTNKYRK